MYSLPYFVTDAIYTFFNQLYILKDVLFVLDNDISIL